jgi:acyl-CoA reductase-like NAD-dependent aldehyde dehydrogenase
MRVNPRNAEKLRKLVTQGKALPAPDERAGRFPIEDQADLQRAIKAVGRVRPATEQARAKVRRHIMARARALKLEHLIPSEWADDGSLTTN